VLVDPILMARYGEEYTSSPVEIYPPRKIDVGRMPIPAAVILSHEHSDHFHLPSLDLLDRRVPIIVGPTMIDRVVRCIERLGFEVHRLEYGTDHRFGSVMITLYPAGEETVLWESRVSQIYVRDADDPEIGGFYLCVDALLSDQFLAGIEAGSVPAPCAIAVSNNSQITPAGVFGSLDNLAAPDGRDGGTRSHGLDILDGILRGTAALNPRLAHCHYMICGGGFLKDYEEMGPFPLSEQADLAAAAKKLTLGIDVTGPEPGEVLEVDPDGFHTLGRLSWLETDRDRYRSLIARRERFMASGASIPMRQVVQPRADDQYLFEVIERELIYLGRAVSLAPLGRELIAAAIESGDASRTFVVKLLAESGDRTYAYDLRTSRFDRTSDLATADAIVTYPFGIVGHASDLAAVLDGDLQIWDIAGVGLRSWYRGPVLSSPVALMYDAFGEQIRADLACRAYDLQLAHIENVAKSAAEVELA
jgi:hypothetical protein